MPFRLIGLLIAALCLGLATQAVAADAVVRKAPETGRGDRPLRQDRTAAGHSSRTER